MKTAGKIAVGYSIMIIVITLIAWYFTPPTEATDNHEERIAQLEADIALHLEELKVHEEHILQLEELQKTVVLWTDPGEVAHLTAEKLWERANSCQGNDDCYYRDSMLSAFYPLYQYERHQYITDLTLLGNWTAEQVEKTSWLVTAQLGDDKATTFLANTTYRTFCWTELDWCKE